MSYESSTPSHQNGHHAGATPVEGEVVSLHQAGAQSIHAHQVDIHQGGSGVITAETVTIREGGAGLILAGQTVLAQSQVGLLATRHANLERTRVGLLLAGRVEGQVEAVIGPQTAALMATVGGAVLGLFLGLIGLWGRQRRTPSSQRR